jgi:ectoine hydroxylase-related dioxygenase (phytanoyl-CoA dioxygenase family)
MDKDKVFIKETTNYTTKETTTTNNNNNRTTSLQRGKQNPTKRVVNPMQRVARLYHKRKHNNNKNFEIFLVSGNLLVIII